MSSAVGVGVPVCDGAGVRVGSRVAPAVGAVVEAGGAVGGGVAAGVDSASGVCVGVGVGTGTSVSAGATVAVGCGSVAALEVADGADSAVGPTVAGVSAVGTVCSSPQAARKITADRHSSSTVEDIPVPIGLLHNDFIASFSAPGTVGSMTRPVKPAGRPVGFRRCQCLRCAPWKRKWQRKTLTPGQGLSRSPANGWLLPLKISCLPLVVSSWQTGSFCSPGYVGSTQERLCEPHFQRSTALSGVLSLCSGLPECRDCFHSATRITVDAEHPARMLAPLLELPL